VLRFSAAFTRPASAGRRTNMTKPPAANHRQDACSTLTCAFRWPRAKAFALQENSTPHQPDQAYWHKPSVNLIAEGALGPQSRTRPSRCNSQVSFILGKAPPRWNLRNPCPKGNQKLKTKDPARLLGVLRPCRSFRRRSHASSQVSEIRAIRVPPLRGIRAIRVSSPQWNPCNPCNPCQQSSVEPVQSVSSPEDKLTFFFCLGFC
jgi:hypothetical protein